MSQENNADNFKLSHNETLADLLARNDLSRLNDFIAIARRTIASGGEFMLTDTQNGIELGVHATYRTPEEVEQWVSDLNALRAKLRQDLLG